MRFFTDNLKLARVITTLLIWTSCACLLSAIVFSLIDQQVTARLDVESVELTSSRSVSYKTRPRVSDFIDYLNGTLIDDYEIDTSSLGEQDISFRYRNVQGKIRRVNFNVNIIDDVSPVIYGLNAYTVKVGYDGNLVDLMLSGDELDDTPRREVVGTYDLNSAGSYTLEYRITDQSGNTASQPFTLRAIEDLPTSPIPSTAEKDDFADVVRRYKTPQTKVGIDVSSWQGEIDWSKLKSSGVEFAFIRIGYQVDYDGEYVVDKYFTQNINNANTVGIPVGVYFYSYANTIQQARKQADWVADQLSDYQVDLGIAFDWENWSEFNISNMSFRTLNNVAAEFIGQVNQRGYAGILYGSKNYLERFWTLDSPQIWLAQYYHQPTYNGKFSFWQMSSSGSISGINGDVDIDIMYLSE